MTYPSKVIFAFLLSATYLYAPVYSSYMKHDPVVIFEEEGSLLMRCAIFILQEFEGFSKTVYIDVDGTLRIGYGTLYEKSGIDTISIDDATDLMLSDYLAILNTISERYYDGKKDARSFAVALLAYNVGINAIGKGHTGRLLRMGEKPPFCQWVKSEGRTLKGLVRRRHAESAFYDFF